MNNDKPDFSCEAFDFDFHDPECLRYAQKFAAARAQSIFDEWDKKRIERAVADLLYADPHHWSPRPCGTCKSATALLGVNYGCVRLVCPTALEGKNG